MKPSFTVFEILELIPLPIFLISAAWIDPQLPQDWLGPFVAGSLVAILTTTILLYNHVLLNRLMLGINLYLVIGSIGLVTQHAGINEVYGDLKASGMLAAIIIVGALSLVVSPAGFIGVLSQDRKMVVIFSLSLLLVAVLAFSASLYFQGDKLYSEIIPFLGLFAARKILHTKMPKPT
ncbi:MAG: hypothetical protein OEZ57_16425 [Nitrospirota bacterium]|nr:hypothetical protein [Nitrospirota bacterium]MDH5588088.1 hypothetical protein [Nitrospirota bacterium]MDH5776488.1 hypothetical protein [Nitrospirota bacterium]